MPAMAQRILRILNLTSLAAVLVFGLAPRLDLRAAALFFRPGAGFWLVNDPWVELPRRAFWIAGDTLALIGLALWLIAWAAGPGRQVPGRLWGFVFLTMALGPGLLVNLVMKPLWGRARPADILAFGGPHRFTPFYLPTDQCGWGCSFVSGEAASAVAVAAILGVLLWPHLARRGRRRALLGLAAFALLAAGLRVAAGRHFPSDVVFGGLLAGYVAWALYQALDIGAAAGRFTVAALVADFGRLRRRPGVGSAKQTGEGRGG